MEQMEKTEERVPTVVLLQRVASAQHSSAFLSAKQVEMLMMVIISELVVESGV